MKGTPMSLWLSAANRTAGWWQGHFTNAWRQQSAKAMRAAMSSAVAPPIPASPAKPSRTTRRRAKKS
ncbi:Uncharacterised protein [Roseomonas gilardii subsp. rosea]|nr:Uncharacterised protein [Roseomonas gilardii subsp. rosea]